MDDVRGLVLVLCQDSSQKVTIRNGILLRVLFLFVRSVYLNFRMDNHTPILTVQLNASRYSICGILTLVMEPNFAVNGLMHVYLHDIMHFYIIVKLIACCLLGLPILTYIVLIFHHPSCILKAANGEIGAFRYTCHSTCHLNFVS